MQKTIIRNLRPDYGARWSLLKSNIKNDEVQILSLHDKFIIDNLNDGNTLVLDFIGLQYKKIIKNLDLSVQVNKKYDNLILDHVRFKYKSLDEIATEIVDLSKLVLNQNAKIIFSFNYQFLKFNRLKYNFEDAISNFLVELQKCNIILKHRLKKQIPSTSPYGDCFFVAEYQG